MAKSLFLKAWSHCLAWDPRHLDIFGGHSRAFQLGTWFIPTDSTRPGAGCGWEEERRESAGNTTHTSDVTCEQKSLSTPDCSTEMSHTLSTHCWGLGAWGVVRKKGLKPGVPTPRTWANQQRAHGQDIGRNWKSEITSVPWPGLCYVGSLAVDRVQTSNFSVAGMAWPSEAHEGTAPSPICVLCHYSEGRDSQRNLVEEAKAESKISRHLNNLMDTDTNILNKVFANQIQEYIQKIAHHSQAGLIPEMVQCM
ncbi:hypothetical protein ACRRTK_006174 [Alexandromys fortis]